MNWVQIEAILYEGGLPYNNMLEHADSPSIFAGEAGQDETSPTLDAHCTYECQNAQVLENQEVHFGVYGQIY